jgi:CheY-like chemotaxis protein
LSKRILLLLIDDDQDDAELFADALKELEIDAVMSYFHDGNEGVEKLRKKQVPMPDIIFLDINMPQIDGWECLKKIKTIDHLQNIPVVMYSTSSFDKHILKSKEAGASAFLTKPNHFEELKTELSLLFSRLLPG